MQPELFRDFQSEVPARRFLPPLFPHRFVRLRVAYEDLIFCTLGLVLVVLAGFCLGVERGKLISGDRFFSNVPVPETVVARGTALPVPPQAARQVTVNQPAAKETSGQQGVYAIQLASYAGDQAAQAEAGRLQRLGFTPRVVKQGRFFELRVVGYETKAEASGSLAMLKKTYHDSFIKRLSS